MLKKHRNLLSIIKSALTDNPTTIDDMVDYEELFELSKKHQIIPLVFHGLYKVKGNFEGSEKFKDYTMRLLFHDQNQLYCLRQIEKAFLSNDIDYMPLKGASIKSIYPSSELRLMGDIDILIKEEQYEKIRKILPQIGFFEVEETDHELIWRSSAGILVELHKRLIPSYNDDYYSYYYNSWEKARLEKEHCFSMSKEDEYIYIFTHLTKHYRDGGIGLRHVVDIWLFAMKNSMLNMEYINRELDKLKLKKFHNNVLETIDVWFNSKEDSEISDYITERIIESGSYGIKERCDAANAARESAKSDSVASARKKKIIFLIFMPYSSMKKKYPILRELPMLLPIMWVVRWVDAIINKRSSITRQSERLNKINAQVVDSYNKELEMVGLNFNLKKE